jgi:hypothetical protein
MSSLMVFLLEAGLSESQAIGSVALAGVSLSCLLHWKWGQWRRRRAGVEDGKLSFSDTAGGDLSFAEEPAVRVTRRGRGRRLLVLLGLLGVGLSQAANVTTLVQGWSSSFQGVSDEEGPPQGGWLTGAEVDTALRALLDAGLMESDRRALLFNWGCDSGRQYRLTLLESRRPWVQAQGDLGEMNRGSRLANGYLPLACYLEEAQRLSEPEPESRVFKRLRARVPECAGVFDAVVSWATCDPETEEEEEERREALLRKERVEFRTALARVYPTLHVKTGQIVLGSVARRVCRDAGLRLGGVRFTGPAVLVWESATKRAQGEYKLHRLLRVAAAEYPRQFERWSK